jgi:hypothetical protein
MYIIPIKKEELFALVSRLKNEQDECTRGSGIVGGHLHIVIDDGNTCRGDVQFCLDEAEQESCGVCTLIATGMLQFSESDLDQFYKDNWGLR